MRKSQATFLAEKLAALRRKPRSDATWEELVNAYQEELGEMWEEFSTAVAEAASQDNDIEINTAIILSMVDQFADDMALLGREYIFDAAATGFVQMDPDMELLMLAGAKMGGNEQFIDGSLVPDIRLRLTTFFSDPANIITAAAVTLLLMPMQARVESYAGQAWATINEGVGIYAKQINSPVYWARDSLAEHCDSCLEFGGRSYPSYDVLLAETGGVLPANGTICRGNCRCSLMVKEDGEWLRP